MGEGNKALCPHHNPKAYMIGGAVILGLVALRYYLTASSSTDEKMPEKEDNRKDDGKTDDG